MRRFIVEVLLDAVLLLFIVLLLGIISVGQPFPFGPTSVPILSLRGAGIIGFVGPVVVTVGMAVVTVGLPLFSARWAARPSPPAVP